MRLKDIPPSDNIEDRRKDQSLLPTETLAEQAARRVKPDPNSKIAHDAGINDIGKKP